MLPDFVYKIVSLDEWDDAMEKGKFHGAEIDLKDGYIHFSTAAQVAETAQKHFSGRDDLMIVKVATAPDARHYKMEPSRGGALFPHLYAPLPVSSAAWWQELPLRANGEHSFPGELAEDMADEKR